MNKEELNDDYYPDYKATVNPVRTLRDEFAMAAMNGIISSRSMLNETEVVQRSYIIADKMMEVRGYSND
jgi:hypothetical protein